MCTALLLALLGVALLVSVHGAPVAHNTATIEHDTEKELFLHYLHYLGRIAPETLRYPPVLPPLTEEKEKAECTLQNISSTVTGRWITLSLVQAPTGKEQKPVELHRPLFVPSARECLLAEARPTLSEATKVLGGKRVLFIGDSHLRYIYNYMQDFIEGPCTSQTYLRTNEHDSAFDGCSPSSRRPGGRENVIVPLNLGTRGGVYPDSATEAESHPTATTSPPAADVHAVKVSLHTRWAPRQFPFAENLRTTEECLKTLTAWEKQYMVAMLGKNCTTFHDLFVEEMRDYSPDFIVIGPSQIHWEGPEDDLFREFSKPHLLREKDRTIVYCHSPRRKSFLARLEAELGYRTLDMSEISTSARLTASTHSAGPLGAVLARALYWKLAEVDAAAAAAAAGRQPVKV